MIVRTYARRNRCVSRSFSDSGFNGGTEDGFQDSLSQESSQEVFGIGFSSQDSSPWSFDSDLYGSSSNRDPDSQALLPPRPVQNGKEIRKSTTSRKTARERERGTGEFRNPNFGGSKVPRTISAPSTSTLMEAQEFGEMMEHVDEVNFALDGLKPGQPSRVRRSSLLSLLSICVTGQQRRLLRAQGMARTIVDAILALSFDDSPSTLAAAALFYVFASDGQDDHLLDSPPCIHFLLKLLNPPMADIIEDKVPNVGGKFLSISRDPSILRGVAKRLDCSSTAIVSKVQEVLLSCKEIKPWNGEGDGLGRPELNSKWIALLTMEKACLSAVSLEDTSGTVRRVGGNFKEKLRELGGFDSVFDVATSCHTDLEEGQLKHLPSSQELKNDSVFQSVVALLKCLQIMVNATFLSTDNQNHLLGMSAKLDSEGSPISFVGFVIRAIKILSGLFLLESARISSYEKSTNLYDEANNQLKDGHKVSGGMDGSASGDSIRKCCITETSSLNGSFIAARKRRRLSMSQPEVPASAPATTSTSASDVYSITEEANSTFPILSHSSLRRLNEANFYVNGSKMDETHLGAGDTQLVSLVDSEDPFAFDEFDLAPSKWELLSMKKAVSRTQKSRKVQSEPDYGCELRVATTIDESTIDENLSSCETSGSSAIEEENSNLVGDCLLTAIKVLVNLTNDNPLGCQQIASCGGLDAMAALIIAHFPMYSCGLSKDSQISSFKLKNTTDLDHRESKPLCDQELEFLVAILGLLVNLVEKDDRNRSRLAAASVALLRPGGTDGKESHIDVIVLLCSIFLANQGSSEAAEGKLLPWNDEAALLQGEREAEQMIIEAYAALLLAFLSTESLRVRDAISCYLPNHNLQVLVPVLERFVAFHLALNMISPETHATVTKVIESCRGE